MHGRGLSRARWVKGAPRRQLSNSITAIIAVYSILYKLDSSPGSPTTCRVTSFQRPPVKLTFHLCTDSGCAHPCAPLPAPPAPNSLAPIPSSTCFTEISSGCQQIVAERPPLPTAIAWCRKMIKCAGVHSPENT